MQVKETDGDKKRDAHMDEELKMIDDLYFFFPCRNENNLLEEK